MKKIKTKNLNYSLLLGLGLLCFDRLFWASDPAIATKYTVPSVGLSGVVIFHGLTVLGLTLTGLGMGRYFADSEQTLATAVKLWSWTVFSGIVTLTVYFFFQKEISAGALYNVILPFSRNTYPLITGFCLGLVFLPLYRKLLQKNAKLVYLSFALIFSLPTLFNQDIFGFVGGNSVIFGIVIFYLGVTLKRVCPRATKQNLVLGTGVTLIFYGALLAFMPLISKTVHGDLTTAYRFVNSSNLLAVLLASEIYLWSAHLSAPKWSFNLAYVACSMLVISGSSDVLNAIVTANTKLTTRVTIILDVVEISTTILVLSLLLFLLKLLPNVRKMAVKIERFFPELANEANVALFLKNVKQYLKTHQPYLIGLLGAYILAFFSFLMMNTSWQISPNVDVTYALIPYLLGQRQFLILFTTLIFFMIFKFLWSLTDRFWLAEIVTLLVVIIWTIANRLKIAARNEPIMPSEFSMFKAWWSLLGMVNIWVIVATVCGIIIASGAIIYLEHKHPLGRRPLRARLVWLILPLIFFSGAGYLNHQKSFVHIFMDKMGDDPTFYNQLAGAQKNGPFLQFLNNLDVKIMDKPSNYSKQTMEQLKARYVKRAQQINASRQNTLGDQTVIFVLSESFSDPTRVPGIELSNDPIKYVRKLKQQTTSGYMLSSGYGGGTANMEYMALTGFNLANFSPTLPTPYTQLVPQQSYAPAITTYFPEAVAIHPYLGVYYSRQEVYAKFGFDRFMYLGSKYPIKHQKKIDRSPYLSDETAFANTLDQVKAAKEGLFINLVTMQNHFPYYNNYYNDSEMYEPTGTAATDQSVKDMVKDFSKGLEHTDKAVEKFIAQLEKIDKPITIVFYGDHLPGIYTSVDMTKYGLELHETDYFVYSNAAAVKQGAKKLTQHTALVTSTDFPAIVSEQTNAKVSPYYALLTDIYQKLPAITLDISENTINSYNSNMQLIDQTGKTVSEKSLSKEQKQILTDYKLAQYDLTAGKQYLKGTFIDK
ncbi:MAG: sulfatase-like hydrolase/transferase [Lactobacillus sp.]|nr:sulfatase-like hydrolase/transferase [Lactobacillus sp.]